MDDPRWDPDGYLQLRNSGKHSHRLVGLFQEIDKGLASLLLEISERLWPGYSLDCSKLFVGTRHRYEFESLPSFYTEVFELGPHLDQVLEELIRAATV